MTDFDVPSHSLLYTDICKVSLLHLSSQKSEPPLPAYKVKSNRR